MQICPAVDREKGRPEKHQVGIGSPVSQPGVFYSIVLINIYIATHKHYIRVTNTRAPLSEAQTIEFSYSFGAVQIGVSIISPEICPTTFLTEIVCKATSHMVDLVPDLQGKLKYFWNCIIFHKACYRGVCGGGEGFSVHAENIMKEARRWIVAYGIIE